MSHKVSTQQSNDWALIENGAIRMIVDGLPSVWLNIHDLHLLDMDELADLSWAGHPGSSIIPVIQRRPPIDPEFGYYEGPFYKLEASRVYADFHPRDRRLDSAKRLNTIPISDLESDIL